MKVLYLGSNEKKNSGKDLTRLKQQGLLKGSRKWIVWKKSYKNVRILKGNLIIWRKYKWNIEK